MAVEQHNNLAISVEINNDITPEQQSALVASLEENPLVKSVEFKSKEEMFNDPEFRSQFDLPIDEVLDCNPLNDCYKVVVDGDDRASEAIETLRSSIAQMEGVAYVNTPSVEAVETMQSNIRSICLVLAVFLLVLLIISVLLLNNTIRLAIYSKRYLINTMKLVGATKWYIMRPLLISALKQGVWAGVISSILVAGVAYGIGYITPATIELLDYKAVAIIGGALILLGVVISVIFSAFAVNNFVNMKSNKIHLY